MEHTQLMIALERFVSWSWPLAPASPSGPGGAPGAGELRTDAWVWCTGEGAGRWVERVCFFWRVFAWVFPWQMRFQVYTTFECHFHVVCEAQVITTHHYFWGKTRRQENELRYPPNIFDLVVLRETLMYLDKEDKAVILRKIKQMLRLRLPSDSLRVDFDRSSSCEFQAGGSTGGDRLLRRRKTHIVGDLPAAYSALVRFGWVVVVLWLIGHHYWKSKHVIDRIHWVVSFGMFWASFRGCHASVTWSQQKNQKTPLSR